MDAREHRRQLAAYRARAGVDPIGQADVLPRARFEVLDVGAVLGRARRSGADPRSP
jgi:hypothetical protein